MGRGNLIAERLVSKLKANGIIHRNAPTANHLSTGAVLPLGEILLIRC